MAVLNITHIRSLIYAKQIIKGLYKCNRGSVKDRTRKHNIQKLSELQDLLLQLIKGPMFDELQNLDTGGPLSPRCRLNSAIYSIAGEMTHGNPDAPA